MRAYLLCIFVLSCFQKSNAQETIYKTDKGLIEIVSYAPLEIIKARSHQLRGAIKSGQNTFAFSVSNASFAGFRNDLQKEHFNDNYLESTRYPNCTFSGKIIEDIDFNSEGSYDVRAKGIMEVHGVKQERIIRVHIEVKNKQIEATSKFTVLLQDHDITIPKVVYQKISEEISIQVQIVFGK